MQEKSDLDLASELSEACRTQAIAGKEPDLGNRPWVRPVHSNALAVHPDDVEEAREDARKCGVPVDFKPNGTPIFTSARQMREYAKRHNFRHLGY